MNTGNMTSNVNANKQLQEENIKENVHGPTKADL
jgi:hypothetical protein